MTFLVIKIDEESRENGIDGRDFSKSPAFVRAISAFSKLDQGINLFGLNLPGCS